ncbi:hypothetical protein ABW20_dc0102536 [Dactylellina cionopaga]|nr:hypothetical protein ABW20_dc0102536 [Dactylellina cionopaga]
MIFSQNPAKLPNELVREICSYLDQASLKSLRQTCSDPVISTSTGEILFKTLVFRLGTLEWTEFGAVPRLAQISQSVKVQSEITFLDNVKTLIIDTRYPFTVIQEDCIIRHELIESMGRYWRYKRHIQPFEQLISKKEQISLVELLQKVAK